MIVIKDELEHIYHLLLQQVQSDQIVLDDTNKQLRTLRVLATEESLQVLSIAL